jgi:PAS domain S-box-containing protein
MHNPAINKILGFESSESLIGKEAREFYVNPSEGKKYYTQLISTGRVKNQVITVKRKDGQKRIVQVNAHLIPSQSEEPELVEGTMMDITDKYILEQKVQDSQEKYQLISENVDDLITIINSNLEMDYLNEAAHFKILGYPIEDLIRKNFLSLLRPENSEDSRNMLNQGFDTGEMLQEIQFRHKDGAYIWFETNGKHYIDDSGEEKLILVSREITERKEAEDLLREEEEKFRSMAEQALLGIGIFQDDIIQFANQALADIVEMNVQDILSMPVNKYIKNIHPDDLHFILEQLEVKQSGESEEVTHYNARMITTSGNIKWVEIFSKSIFYRGRSADFITAIDITDKVNAEQKLRESEESYRLLVENQTDMIVETDLEGKFLFVSPSYCEIFGKTEGELLGTSFMPLVHENDRNSTSKSRESLIHPPYRAYHEQRALTKNGWRWIAWSDSALFDSENNIIGGIGVGRDVTERVLAEQALKESEEKYRLISENANDIIVIVNQKTKLEYINEIVTPMMGYAKDEVVGKKAFSFIHPDDMDRTASGIKTAFEVGEEKIDIRVRHKDQHWVWFEVKANKFIDGDGNPKLLVVMRDITERKNAERALKDLNIELEWKIEERTRELKESEEKYRNMINHLDVGFFHTKFSGEILNHNYALSQILGYERKESLVGFKASEFWANPERLKNYTEELKQKEAIKGFIHEAIKKNGEKIILQVDSHLVRDEDKDTLEIEGTVSDITDKFVLEQKYRHLFENSPFAIWLIDLKGTLIDCNSTTNKLLSKYSREDLIGKNFREILDLFASPKRLTSFFQKAFKKLIDEGSIAHNEFQMTKGDGSLIWITIQSTLINLEGEILIQVIIQDITERKNAEQKLKESEEKFRHLFESSPYSIILVDTKGKISDCNLSTERIFGVTKERITGRNYMDLHIQPKEHMSFFVERYKRLFKGELPEPMEFKVAKVDGTPIWINVQDSLVKIGDEMFFQVIIQDISEKKEAEEQIKASEERWRSLVENAPNIISIVDRDTKIQFINRTIPPYTIAETIGKPYTDYLTPEYYDISLDAIEQVFATGDSGYYETKIKIPNGFVWFETYVGPIIHDDEVIAATLINNDITERKKTEQIIKESEERWRSLVENAPNIIIIIDENKNIQFINRTIPPYTIAETIGKNIFEYIFPKYEQNVTDIIDHVFSTGEGDYFEVTIPYSGGIIWFESFVGPIIHEDKVIAVTLIASDITERKNSEQMIRESEERFRHLFEMSPMGIFLTDSKGELIDCNTRTTDLLGFEREELIGRGYLEMLSLVKAQELTSLFEDRSKKLFQGEFVDSIELPCYRKDGSLIWVQMHSSLIKVGKEPIMQVILEDITTRKKAEKNLRKSEESLRELNKQLEAKVEERTKELKMSEKKFRQIFESIPDLFFLVDNTSLILDYRGKEEDLYLPPSEFLKRKMADLIPPELGKKEIEAIKKTIETKEPQIFEYILPVKGIEQYYEARHLYFSRNQVAIFIRNITDRKLAEIKLKESEETYRTLVQTSPDAITVTDLRGKIIEVSQKAVEFYRAGSPEELIGLNSFDFIAPEEREQASEVLLLTLKEGITTNKEYTLVRKDGSTYIGELNASIINDAYGNPKAFIATIRDISDRKEAERQIKESEEKYRNLFEDSPLSIVLIDNKGTMIDCNSATFDLFGYEKDELIGKNYLDMLQSYTEESIPQIRTRQELMKRGITPVPQEFQIFKKNKEMIWVLSQVNSLQLGGETHYLAIIQDINERKLAEQILKESEEKLRQQNIELRRIDELKNDFITIAAHELKTPLVSISGYTDFILSHRKDLDSEIREDLTIVQKNSTRLQVLINQLLDVMQIDAKKMDLQRKPVSIREIIENSIEELSYLVKEKSANISIGVREDLQLSVDSLRIMQLFSNLLSNALKFVSNGGKIDITVEKGVTHYVFKVKDDGKGLARNELERIFQKFERIEADKDKGIEKHRGLGLGLYIAKGIVEAHGGKIWASSTGRGKGAEFYFSLPI